MTNTTKGHKAFTLTFACPVCGKAFPTLAAHARHTTTHTTGSTK